MIAEYISARSKLPREEVEWMGRVAEHRVLGRGEAFCRIGQTRHEFGFLLDGILQVYGVSSRGDKVVLDLIFPGTFALAMSGASRGLPADACIEAVTACTLKVWPYELRHTAFARHAEWLRLGLRMAEDSFNQKHQRYLAMRVLSAEERYAKMARELPRSWQLIPQHLVASYLGITPQYLSRIKRAHQAVARARARKDQGTQAGVAGRTGSANVLESAE